MPPAWQASDLTAEERREMLATVNKNLANYEKTRAVDLPFTVVPPLYFNPVVPGLGARPRRSIPSERYAASESTRERRGRTLGRSRVEGEPRQSSKFAGQSG